MSECTNSPWDFVCRWYNVDSVQRAISRRHIGQPLSPIPSDIRSREFAEWLTEQYRLAMNKGIEIGRKWDDRQRTS